MQIRNLRTHEVRELGPDWAIEVTDLAGLIAMVVIEQPGRVAIITSTDKESTAYADAFRVTFCKKLPVPPPIGG